jgi:hypothetical protein
MAEFLLNQPVQTDDPKVEVTISPDAPLPVGVVRFQLVVVDDLGNQSEPNIREVIIRDSGRPTAILDAPPEVEVGQSFTLTGDRSSDVAPGTVVRYIWTLIATP